MASPLAALRATYQRSTAKGTLGRTVQFWGPHGPPVSDIIEALTAKMYAICAQESNSAACLPSHQSRPASSALFFQVAVQCSERTVRTVRNVTVPARSSVVRHDLRSFTLKYFPAWAQQTEGPSEHSRGKARGWAQGSASLGASRSGACG